MKNSLIVIQNKKLDISSNISRNVISAFASAGYYFERISYVAFDNGEEITRQLKDCKQYYDNAVVVFPEMMRDTLKKFVSKLYESDFVGFRLQKEDRSVFFIGFEDGLEIIKEGIRSISEKCGVKYDKFYIKLIGAAANKINRSVKQVTNLSSDIEFNISDEYGESALEILYSDKTPKMVLDDVTRRLVADLDEYIYALDNISIAERLFQLLKLRRMKICVAESFTGGGICRKLVAIPGMSSVFYEGLNTYSNQSKIDRLGVKELTLKQHGAVSAETAYEMAEGLIGQGNCDISVATTGIAGPKSDGTKKPVGLCYIAVGLKENVFVYQYNLEGNRDNITNTAINYALFLAYKHLK